MASSWRKIVPMETDDPDGEHLKLFSSRYPKTSSTNTSTVLSESHDQPSHWCFFKEEILFVKKIGGSELTQLKRDGEIKWEEKEDMLTISCRTTSRRDVYDYMQKLQSRVLKKYKTTLSVPFSSQKRIEKYITERNTIIKDGYLHMQTGYVYIYGLNDEVTKREKTNLEALQNDIKSESKSPVRATQQQSGSLGNGARSTMGASSKPSQPKHDQSMIQSRTHPVAAPRPRVDRNPLFTTREGIEVYVYKHSITALHTDAIVNAANEDLRHIGGVAKVIADIAGAVVEYECSSIIYKNGGPLTVTNSVHTKAGNLKNKYIIHAVGPRWDRYGNKENCLNDLSWTVELALDKAAHLGCVDVGMPAISAGIFGVPKVLCAEMYIRGIVQHSKQSTKAPSVKQIHIVDIDDEIIREIHTAHKKWQANPNLVEPKESYRQFSHALSRPRSSRPASGNRHPSDIPVAGCSSTRKGDGRGKFWMHHATSRIPGLDDSVENFESDNGFFKVRIYTGSIVRVKDVNAILCSADNIVSGQGPLGMAIRTAGGYQYEKNFKSLQGHTFNSKETVFRCEAGNLSVQYVVHVVMDTITTADSHKLQKYKQQVRHGFNKVNSWKLKAIALPLVGAGFVEKSQHDLDKVCGAMQETLTAFCREERSCKLCEVHLVNRNSSVTKTLMKCFIQNSVPAAISHRHPSNGATAATTGGFQETEKGARPKSSTCGVESTEHSKQQGHHGKHDSKSFSRSVKDPCHTPSKKLSATVHSSSWTADDLGTGDIKAGKETKPKSLRNTRLKQTQPSGNISILGGTEVHAPSNGKTVVTNRLRQSDNPKRYEEKVCSECKTSNAEMVMLQCGHAFCTVPCFLPMKNNRLCSICNAVDDCNGRNVGDDEDSSDEYHDADDTVGGDAHKTDDMCVICMDSITDSKRLLCGHVFCSDCIMQSMAHKPACPICGKIFGELEGDQPEDGTMTVTKASFPSLPGYEGDGTIEIKYVFRNGIQKENHPQPGKPYKGTERRAFLPANKEGQKVLRLLKKAFDSRLTFTIGSSRTTGQEDVVTWNDIHHKTKRDGGAAKFGYPDPTYLSRVQDELAAKGIKE